MDPVSTTALLIKGVIIGLIAAVPIGPVNLIVMQRTLCHGRLNGFVTGLGAMLGDGLFAIVAGFGISAVSSFVVSWSWWIQLVGAGILFAMGLHTFFSRPRLERMVNGNSKWPQSLVSTFALTVTNPVTMLWFAAIFASVGSDVAAVGIMAGPLTIVAGVVLGSGAWWLTVSQTVGRFRTRLNEALLRVVNRVAGTLIALFGIAMLARLALAT